MALTPAEKLRNLLGEAVPAGGSASDTLFSDAEIDDLLFDANNDIEKAAYDGWRIKAAQFASLVDVTDGNASRKMGELRANAEEMVKLYLRTSSGPTEGRTRIGRIRRT